jgi:hypothetical protein
MCGGDDTPRCQRILRRNDVREGLRSEWSLVRERVLFYVPVKVLHSVNDIVPDLSVVRGVRCSEVTWSCAGEGFGH